jgi:hypothetical protein
MGGRHVHDAIERGDTHAATAAARKIENDLFG